MLTPKEYPQIKGISKYNKFLNKISKIVFNNFFQNNKTENILNNAEKHQDKTINKLLEQAKNTKFWKEYNFKDIKSYEDFKKQVPIYHYEEFFDDWIKPMLKGEENVTRPWKIPQFARTWWTTSRKEKFVPITNQAIKTNHMAGPTLMLNFYFRENPNTKIFEWQTITIWWWFTTNPETWEDNVWFISAILQKESPKFIKRFKTPDEKVSFWLSRDEKIQRLLENTIDKNITWMAGIPLRNQTILEKILEKTGKSKIQEIWPNFEVFMTGWTWFEPYKESFEKMRWKDKVNVWKVYNASEWVFAIQTDNNSDDGLLLTNHWVFYEFIPLNDYHNFANKPEILKTKTLKIDQIETDKEYALVITTNAWLRRYIIWDTIKFTNKSPYKIQVTWRTKFFIDAFNEHTLLSHIKKAIDQIQEKNNFKIEEFTVWPDVDNLKYQWIIETANTLTHSQKAEISKTLDIALQNSNDNYRAKREDNWWVQEWEILFVKKGTFADRFNSQWKAGWQTKIPQMKNDLDVVNTIKEFIW